MENIYKSIILLIIGIFLTFLTYKASLLIEEKCIMPNVVDFSCSKSIFIFLSLGFLIAFVFIKNLLMITDAKKEEKKK